MIAVIILLLIIIIALFEVVKFKNKLKNWLTTGVDCAKNADPTCNPIYDSHGPGTDDPLIKALVVDAIFIRSLFDPATAQPDIKIYSAQDPSLAMVGIYYDIDGTCWVAFRGTMTGADITTDFNDSEQSPDIHESAPTAAVHSGMYALYSELKPKIDAALESVPAGTPISICGHSLGAALAIYAGYDMPNSPVYAYAPPRTGNMAFANAAPGNINSIINIADIVPTLPYSYTMDNFQYTHVGTITMFNVTGKNILDCHNLLTYYNGLINFNSRLTNPQ